MPVAQIARQQPAAVSLFDRIGALLDMQGLPPNPANYGLAHAALTGSAEPRAREFARLAAAGPVSRADLVRLGGSFANGAAPAPPADAGNTATELLAAETQAHVAGIADIVRAIHDETRGFGRDLAESAAVIDRLPAGDAAALIARMTGAMQQRVSDAETRLASAVAEAEQLRARLAEATDTARRDPLTGLANRRALDEALADRAAKDAPHCLAVCDVDRFKRINDGFGHAVGDRVLRVIAQMLAEACPDALVARYGGEEFVILFSGVPLVAAERQVDGARIAIGARRFRTRDGDAPIGQVTFSAGVTTIDPHEAPSAAYARADRLLYAAKAAGRDRILAE